MGLGIWIIPKVGGLIRAKAILDSLGAQAEEHSPHLEPQGTPENPGCFFEVFRYKQNQDKSTGSWGGRNYLSQKFKTFRSI